MVRAGDWQTFGVGVLLIVGCFYGLYFVPEIAPDQRGALFGLLGLVSSYFLSKHTSDAAAVKAVAAANGHVLPPPAATPPA